MKTLFFDESRALHFRICKWPTFLNAPAAAAGRRYGTDGLEAGGGKGAYAWAVREIDDDSRSTNQRKPGGFGIRYV